MKPSMSKPILGILAALATIGVAHADEGKVLIQATTEQHQIILADLLAKGFLVSIPEEPNWYQLDKERLKQAVAPERDAALSVEESVAHLKNVVGQDVNIKIVPISEARAGTQDLRAAKSGEESSK